MSRLISKDHSINLEDQKSCYHQEGKMNKKGGSSTFNAFVVFEETLGFCVKYKREVLCAYTM